MGRQLLLHCPHTRHPGDNSKYPLIRAKLPSRKMFFQHIQALTCYHCFEGFDALLDCMMKGWKLSLPDTS